MLAIDFGTSRVKVAYLHEGEAKLAPSGRGNIRFIPSLFYLPKAGGITPVTIDTNANRYLQVTKNAQSVEASCIIT